MNLTDSSIHKSRYTNKRSKKTHFVIHWPVMKLDDLSDHFKGTSTNSSYHYCIGNDGRIVQYVPTHLIAHHAGTWNNKAIGIALEGGYLENGQRVSPSKEAHDACAELMKDLAGMHKIDLNRDTVKKHSEVRPNPTMCPGTTDIDYIINKANEEDMNLSIYLTDEEWNAGKFKGRPYCIRMLQNVNILMRLPRSQEFLNSGFKDTWHAVKFQGTLEKTLEYYAAHYTVEFTRKAFLADYRDWAKRNPVKKAVSPKLDPKVIQAHKLLSEVIK